ncbi:hypothetical protein [Microbacterium sp. cf332]|uniref:hypothetical protein n=1 Tax=Microbacterium sp. cf332 TaxID=1761804 RepID=UPI000886C144|nr:hypothetical protein [Microbacterium sp. cf332]SDQ67729.1 hypothetical protein SAMN04487847_2329 [Microbacterium sp. cf332]
MISPDAAAAVHGPALLSARPDPELWSLVPVPEQADGWLHGLVETHARGDEQRIVDAGILALRTQAETDAALVFLLHEDRAAIVASLALFAYADVPAPTSADDALRVAESLTRSTWQGEAIEVSPGEHRGWRVTVLESTSGASNPDGPAPDASVFIADFLSTLYFLDVAGGMVLAVLSPLRPEAAFVAQRAAEQVLETLEVSPA